MLDKSTGVGHFLIVEERYVMKAFLITICLRQGWYIRRRKREALSEDIFPSGEFCIPKDLCGQRMQFSVRRKKVNARREEGAKIVEMEQAGCIAVTQFRGVDYGAIIYGGDDVSGDDWDTRSWRSREDIRQGLVDICREIVLMM